MPVGSVGYEAERTEKGQVHIWLEERWLNKSHSFAPAGRELLDLAGGGGDLIDRAPLTRTSCLSAFRPRPCRNAPALSELSKGHRENRISLRDLLSLQVDRHGCGHDHICGVAGNIDMARLDGSDAIT